MKPLAVAALIGVFSPITLADSLPPQTVTKPGTSARAAQGVQGVTSGVPLTITCPDGTCSGSGGPSAGLTDTELRATPVPVSGSGTFDISDRVGRALGAVSITGSVAVTGTFWQTTQPVSGTFWQTTQPVSGTVTANISGSISNTTFASTQGTSPWVTADNHTTAAAPLSLRLSDGAAFYAALTDTQLRATPVPVSGTVTASGPLTDTQLRATPVPVSGTVAATESGTWTVQPGNTANTTPWLVTGNQTPATAFANPTNAVNVNSLASGWNGATWDRLASAGNNNDAEAVATTGVLDVEGHSMVFNGTSWDRQRGSTQGTVVENAATTTAASAMSQKTYTANTALSVKASAGNVYGWSAINAAATVCWLQFYNTAGTPTCGTAVVWSVPLPVTPGVSNTVSPIPYANFATGIAICVSTTSTGGVTCGSTSSGTIFFK